MSYCRFSPTCPFYAFSDGDDLVMTLYYDKRSLPTMFIKYQDLCEDFSREVNHLRANIDEKDMPLLIELLKLFMEDCRRG